MNLQSLAISAVIITVTIGIGLAILSEFQTTIYQVESGGTGAYGAAYNATGTGVVALATMPDWLSLIILAGAGTAVLGFFLGGIRNRGD
jgi:hypothetical protein